jgi:hypothetical protein
MKAIERGSNLIERINADFSQEKNGFIRVNPPNPRHPRSIAVCSA